MLELWKCVYMRIQGG